MPGPARTLKAADIAVIAKAAGFTGSKLETAVAVAMAESSGNESAVSWTGCCIGLWQINVQVHPYTRAAMMNAAENAKAAYAISSGGANWQPWDAYKSKAYLLYLPMARSAAAASAGVASGVGGGLPAPVPEVSTAQSIADVVQYPAKVVGWISDRQNVFRIVKTLLGGALVLVAVGILARPVVQPIKDKAGQLVGLAAKARKGKVS